MAISENLLAKLTPSVRGDVEGAFKQLATLKNATKDLRETIETTGSLLVGTGTAVTAAGLNALAESFAGKKMWVFQTGEVVAALNGAAALASTKRPEIAHAFRDLYVGSVAIAEKERLQPLTDMLSNYFGIGAAARANKALQQGGDATHKQVSG